MLPASTLRLFRHLLYTCTAALAVIVTDGCSSRPPRGEGPGAEAGEANLPTLVARDQFFGGKLVVDATAGRSSSRRGPGSRGAGGPGGGGRRGGMGDHGPGRREGPGMGEGGPAMRDNSEGPSIHLQESGFPPVALQVKLTNTSSETVEVTFMRCKSDLGDFAVRPEKLALAPGQSAEPDRMTSHLGLTTTALELTVALKLGSTVETKVLLLKPEAPATVAPGTRAP